MMSAIGAVGATFAVVDSNAREVRRLLPVWGSARGADEYFAHFHQFDPQIRTVAEAYGPGIYASQDHLDERMPETADYMKWMRATAGLDHHLTAVTPLGDGGLRAAFSGHGASGTGPVSNAGAKVLRRLLPDLVRAWQLGFQHQELLTDRFWDGLIASPHASAALLLDERGRVVRVTQAALAIAASGEGLSLAGERLCSATPAEDGRLAAVVAGAVRADAPESGAVRIERRSGRRALIVIAYPLVRRRRFLSPCDAAALVRIVDPARPGRSPDTALLAGALGLTRREAELAALLAVNHSVESAAATLGIAVPTARLHLHHLFAKTGTARQSELVGLLRAIE